MEVSCLAFPLPIKATSSNVIYGNGLTRQEPNGVLMGKNLIGGLHISHGGGQNNEIVMP